MEEVLVILIIKQVQYFTFSQAYPAADYDDDDDGDRVLFCSPVDISRISPNIST